MHQQKRFVNTFDKICTDPFTPSQYLVVNRTGTVYTFRGVYTIRKTHKIVIKRAYLLQSGDSLHNFLQFSQFTRLEQFT